MTEPMVTGALAAELHRVILAVDGVTAVFPAQPLWQTIAGAAFTAVTGEPVPPVAVAASGDGITVKARIGVDATHPAPDVARAVAGAIRQHAGGRPCAVEVVLARLGSSG